MTSSTPKRSVRLASLLNGFRGQQQLHREEPQPEIAAEDFLDSIESSTVIDSERLWTTENSSPLQPSNDGKTTAFRDEDRTSDCEIVEESRPPKVSLRNLLSGKSKPDRPKQEEPAEAITDVQTTKINDPNKNRETHERIVSALDSAKKTTVRDLFGRFPKKLRDTSANELPALQKPIGPLKRAHEASKAQMLETPLPKYQKISCMDDKVQHRPLTLPRKAHDAKQDNIDQNLGNFGSLVHLASSQRKDVTENICTNRTVNDPLWTDEFAPQTLKDVVLEDALKTQVNGWLQMSFEKLRRMTTRNKLSKKKADLDDMDMFIVEDENDESLSDQMEEFVPLMILFGDGVGKNTLLQAIMNDVSGQIFEINSSGNRSKKDYMDSLLEFSTSHYVKNKGSKGIILFDDVDVLFRERDKLFWVTLERLLMASRRPIVLVCRDLNFIPFNLIQIADEENSLFHVEKIDLRKAETQLSRFLNAKGLDVSTDDLKTLLREYGSDLRRLLINLQWKAVADPKSIQSKDFPHHKKFSHVSEISDIKFQSNLLSSADMIFNSIRWRSHITGDKDRTLNYPSHSKDFTALPDEERLAFDYMIDYKQHLHDHLKTSLLPFETNMSDNLFINLDDPHARKALNPYPFVERTTPEVVSYLGSRVPDKLSLNGEQSAPVRMTRNSRKVREILDRFSDGPNENGSDFDSGYLSLKAAMTRHQISQEVIPYVVEIAKHDQVLKNKNKEVFEAALRNGGSRSGTEVVKELLHNHAFHPIWFNGEPGPVLDAWESPLDALNPV
ncbi:LAFA_0D02432g1_1 [Lachancea sp. 'fantastica']|nr:LAFA_0D02432g1_1 [Lachancea sp. 'fantastica']